MELTLKESSKQDLSLSVDMMIFLYSGARNTELFRLQRKDVDLDKQEFVILLEKGGQYKRCTKVILTPALEYWKRSM